MKIMVPLSVHALYESYPLVPFLYLFRVDS